MKHIITLYLIFIILSINTKIWASGNDSITIVKQPSDIMQCISGTEKLTIEAIGKDLKYQWQVSDDNKFWKNINGANEAIHYPTSKIKSQTWYRVVVSKKDDSKISTISTSSVVNTMELPTMTINILEGVMCSDKDITFKAVIAGGAGKCTYQWQKSNDGLSWGDIDGADKDTYKAAMGMGIKYRITSKCSGSGCCN